MQTICCVCLKTKNKKGWGRQNVRHDEEISHGYCPDCYREMMHHLNCKIFKKKQNKELAVIY